MARRRRRQGGVSAERGARELLQVGGREVALSNPGKVFFPATGATKLDLALYYLSVGERALAAVLHRPTVLKRFPNGVDGEPFFQKRVPQSRPEWIETVTVTFPSGRTADELCPSEVAHLLWAVNLGCIDLNPWPVRRSDLEHPDELRIDLDPQPGVPFDVVRQVALQARVVLAERGIESYAKTSGSRGLHVYSRISPTWGFDDVRRAALAVAREVERRMPQAATSAWWKKDRGKRVLLDYNQNARDRTVASAYSVRANPLGMVSCPLAWEEVDSVDPEQLTMATVPARVTSSEEPWAGIEENPQSLEGLLDLAAADEESGLGDAPWPPHFPKRSRRPPA